MIALSLAKAKQVAQKVKKGIIIGADTIVVLKDQILGKPKDKAEAKIMLTKLAGNVHKVYTGFTIFEKPGNRHVSDFEVTSVHFRNLAEWEIDRYVQTQNPMDKAGAYGIQDQSAIFADRIEVRRVVFCGASPTRRSRLRSSKSAVLETVNANLFCREASINGITFSIYLKTG